MSSDETTPETAGENPPEGTQDEPVMAGADDATEQEKRDGRREQDEADAQRDSALEDSVRSVRAVGENLGGDGGRHE